MGETDIERLLTIQISHSQWIVVIGFEPSESDAKDGTLYHNDLPPPKRHMSTALLGEEKPSVHHPASSEGLSYGRER